MAGVLISCLVSLWKKKKIVTITNLLSKYYICLYIKLDRLLHVAVTIKTASNTIF